MYIQTLFSLTRIDSPAMNGKQPKWSISSLVTRVGTWLILEGVTCVVRELGNISVYPDGVGDTHSPALGAWGTR